MLETKNQILGSVMGQSSQADEILVVTSLEKAGALKKGTIIAHDTLYEVILLQVCDKITWADISEQDLYLMSENERLALKILEKSPKSYILRTTIVGAIREENNKKTIFIFLPTFTYLYQLI